MAGPRAEEWRRAPQRLVPAGNFVVQPAAKNVTAPSPHAQRSRSQQSLCRVTSAGYRQSPPLDPVRFRKPSTTVPPEPRMQSGTVGPPLVCAILRRTGKAPRQYSLGMTRAPSGGGAAARTANRSGPQCTYRGGEWTR
jgi:hypothetical protein